MRKSVSPSEDLLKVKKRLPASKTVLFYDFLMKIQMMPPPIPR